MSRIGNKSISVPSGVTVSLSNGSIEVKGPKGALTQGIPQGIAVEQANGIITVRRTSEERAVKALHGLARSLISNMVKGVSEGFEKKLEVIGVGYSAKLQGSDLILSVGFTNPVKLPIPAGLSLTEPKTVNVAMPGVGSVPVTSLAISGIDNQLVGQFAATVRSVRPPEPYKGKGIRYHGEEVRRKAGKAMAGGD